MILGDVGQKSYLIFNLVGKQSVFCRFPTDELEVFTLFHERQQWALEALRGSTNISWRERDEPSGIVTSLCKRFHFSYLHFHIIICNRPLWCRENSFEDILLSPVFSKTLCRGFDIGLGGSCRVRHACRPCACGW